MATATAQPDDGQTPATPPAIEIRRLQRATIEVPIIGQSPLIPHKWSEKSLALMREAQSGSKVRARREPKVPEAEAEAALYRLPDGTPGFPATGFKAAIVGAARFFDGVTMTVLKSALFVEGEGEDQLVRLEGEMKIREDTPRNATGVVDLRYRYAFFPWSATLAVTYLPSRMDAESVVALVDAAGNGGVGDWRPSAPKSQTGTFGRFQVRGD